VKTNVRGEIEMNDLDYQKKVAARLALRKSDSQNGCWIYTGSLTSNGYGHTSFNGKHEYVHRIAAIIHLGYTPETKLLVMHRCDTPACFNPAHLQIGTQRENMSDAAAKGRMRGKKLTPEQVAEIKQKYIHGSTYRSLAATYSVSTTAIGQIVRGETWKTVAPNPSGDGDQLSSGQSAVSTPQRSQR
jgi:hypothetical protein